MTALTETDITELKELINTRFEQLYKKMEIGFIEIKGEIKRLDERINGIEKLLNTMDKRLEKVETSQKNQIWTLIGVLTTTIIGLTTRLFFFPGKL